MKMFKTLLLSTTILFASSVIAAPKKRTIDDVETPYDNAGTRIHYKSSPHQPSNPDYEKHEEISVPNSNSKKRSIEEDNNLDGLCAVFKKVEITTRKEEENRLYEEFRTLTAQSWALKDEEAKANYVDTPEIIAAKNRLDKAFALYNIKAKQLRNEVHPATDLTNENWDSDPYWK
jgi:hypothetical protein